MKKNQAKLEKGALYRINPQDEAIIAAVVGDNESLKIVEESEVLMFLEITRPPKPQQERIRKILSFGVGMKLYWFLDSNGRKVHFVSMGYDDDEEMCGMFERVEL